MCQIGDGSVHKKTVCARWNYFGYPLKYAFFGFLTVKECENRKEVYANQCEIVFNDTKPTDFYSMLLERYN